jgi:hypothetical protein
MVWAEGEPDWLPLKACTELYSQLVFHGARSMHAVAYQPVPTAQARDPVDIATPCRIVTSAFLCELKGSAIGCL